MLFEETDEKTGECEKKKKWDRWLGKTTHRHFFVGWRHRRNEGDRVSLRVNPLLVKLKRMPYK